MNTYNSHTALENSQNILLVFFFTRTKAFVIDSLFFSFRQQLLSIIWNRSACLVLLFRWPPTVIQSLFIQKQNISAYNRTLIVSYLKYIYIYETDSTDVIYKKKKIEYIGWGTLWVCITIRLHAYSHQEHNNFYKIKLI